MIAYNELNGRGELAALRDYLVLALRSTGPDPSEDRIFQLGMLRVEDGQIVNRNSTLIDPGRPIPAELTELCGIGDEDAAGGLRYEQMAASLAKLLLNNVVVADEEALGFVRSMLEEAGYSGKFAFVDVRALAAELLPDAETESVEALARQLGAEPEEAQGILHEAALRCAVLQACQALIEPEDASEGEAESAEAPAAEADAEPGAEAKAEKKSRLASLRAKKRPAPRAQQPKKRSRLDGIWEMSTEDFVGYIAAIVSVVAALVFMPSLSSVFFALAALVFLPIRPLRKRLARWHLNGWKIMALGLAFFVLAAVLKPHSPGRGKVRTDEDGPPSFIILSWNEAGDYGEPWTVVNDEGEEEHYIAFHLPVGIYRVLNNNAASAKVTVVDDVPEEKSEEIQDLLVEESSRSVTVLASKSKEITLDEGQHFRLSEDAENVIFQYLSEIPEEVVDEKDEQDDPNATAITAWVNGSQVRMRKSASVSAFIMATFDTGKEVLVTGVTGDWTAVTVDNQKGYIYSRYITYENPNTGN